MKVMFVTSTDDSLGGAQSLLELVTCLKQLGVEIVVVNPTCNNLNAKLDELNIENYSLHYQLDICRMDLPRPLSWIKFGLKYARYLIGTLIAINLAKKFIDFADIDLIHTNNSVEDIGAILARRYHIPHIWHLREFGDLDFHFKYFHRNVGKYINDGSDSIIAISRAVASEWSKKKVMRDKMQVITHGVDGNDFPVIHRNEIVFPIQAVFAGAITPAKGQLMFIQAIAKKRTELVGKFHLDLFGSSDEGYLAKVNSLIEEKHLESIVTYRGFSSTLPQELHSYDVGVVNSRSEAMGRVTIEYMFSGLYVLASDTGANSELLRSCRNGETAGALYSIDSIDSIGNALVTLISHPNLIRSGGEVGREKAVLEYDINKNVHKYLDLYRSVIGLNKKM